MTLPVLGYAMTKSGVAGVGYVADLATFYAVWQPLGWVLSATPTDITTFGSGVRIDTTSDSVLTIDDPNGGGYNVVDFDLTPDRSIGQFYFRSSTGDVTIRPIFRIDDYTGAYILKLLSEGGLRVNDNIVFEEFYSAAYHRGVAFGYLQNGTNQGAALIFGEATNTVSTVTARSSSVTLDAGKGAFIRLNDDTQFEVAMDWIPVITDTQQLGESGMRWLRLFAQDAKLDTVTFTSTTQLASWTTAVGGGNPENQVTAPVSSVVFSQNGRTYKKRTGSGNTGWTKDDGRTEFGSGSDGNVTISAGTTTLTRDMQYADLVVTGNLDTAGYRVFVAGKLTGAGTILSNGGAGAAGGTAGAAVSSAGWFGGSQAGGAGGTAAGTAGSSWAIVRSVGANGGAGGTGSGGAAGAAGTIQVMTVGSFGVTTWATMNPAGIIRGRTDADNVAQRAIGGGAGGGGGGGDGTAGGGGGAGGGVVVVAARDASGFTGTIQANGGNGGTPAAGNRGGGGGGGGGACALITLAAPSSFTIQALGGTAGSGSGTGTAGANGAAGQTVTMVLG